MAGIALMLFGLFPRVAVAAAWTALAVFLLLEPAFEFGQVSEWLLDLSPLTHVPRVLLGASLSPGPVRGLPAAAAVRRQHH
ncbi:hypothetical protein [Nonomuraea africana]|uniref:Exporter of polyketide antibiotics n=1 Tax=Nonomuraea africana TaxID=46171 RepID=A0ABR9KEN6_9ACTN|nr:hypothetical protein [Nonomuraea africana]MBE1560246.1 putative exporter of polyketide antibiotics [Nonomuraea africana]